MYINIGDNMKIKTPPRKQKKIKIIFSFFVIIIGIIISFKMLNSFSNKITNKHLATFLLKEASILEKDSTLKKITQIIKKKYKNPTSLLLININDLKVKNTIIQETISETEKDKTNQLPLIYIYNSHQTEEYAPSSFLEYNVNPTVMLADYILEEVFNTNNYKTLVEESSIKEILNQNSWKYNSSYKASRILLEQRKKENPTLKYFIDVHRDSLERSKTTIEISGKSYAKTIFLIGLENPSYEKNLLFTTKINDCLNIKYPSLSKGIYKKGGSGVNGIYNQDFSEYVVLLEIGGYQNTTTEVMNSSLAFSECFMEVINKDEN